MKNLEKLVMTRALVKEERRQGKWDQTVWVGGLGEADETGVRPVTCGTTACVAGWAVLVDGGLFLSDQWVLARPDDPKSRVTRIYADNDELVEATGIEDRARRLLGLDRYEADELFDGDNDYEDVTRILKRLIKEARKERKNVRQQERGW